MTKKIVAIGGGENGRQLENGLYTTYDTEFIDIEIVKLTNKKNPNFLFIGHAMNFSDEIQENYFQTMKKIYGEKLKCHCRDLKSSELENEKIVKEKIKWADIIYEGGGDTLSMIELWKKTGFDKELYNAWNKGKVICGISAGAVCWFKSCNSDNPNDSNKFFSIDCLNWLNIYMTPHCNEFGRLEYTKIELKNNNCIGIALSDCAALEIIDNKYKVIISKPKDKAFCIKSYWKNGKYKQIKINPSDKLKNVSELLNKQ